MEHRVCHVRDLPAGRGWPVWVGGRVLAVFGTADGVYALDNLCRHSGFPLDDGVVIDGCVTCPWHGWVFELATGSQVLRSYTDDGLPLMRRPGQRRYPTRVVDGHVMVDIVDGA